MKRNTNRLANSWIMAVLGIVLWSAESSVYAIEPASEPRSVRDLLTQIYPYSEYSFMGTVQLLELPKRDPETGRLFAPFLVVEAFKGPDGNISAEIREHMQAGPIGPPPRSQEMPPWQAGTEYYIECRDYDGWHWLESVRMGEAREQVIRRIQSLTDKDIEPSQRTRAMQEDLDQLREQLKEEQQKGNLTRQEVREKMLERMKYYQDQEEPQIIWD